MIRFLLRRLVFLLGMLAGLVLITFAVSNIAPADPAALAAGPDATRDMVETVRREYGLDRPLPEQFLRYVSDLLRGDLGRSVASGNSVGAELLRYVPASLELVLLAMGFSGPEQDAIAAQLGLPFDARGTLTRDDRFQTSEPGVFVAGDAGRGQSLIVWAIAEGRSVAAEVDAYLEGRTELPAPVRPTDRAISL